MEKLWPFALVAMIVVPGVTGAETVYVIDKLVVGVHERKSQASPTIDVVSSGTKLKVLARVDGMAQIRGDKGLLGWVEERYLTAEPPSRLVADRLRQRLQELTQVASAERAKVVELQARLSQLTRNGSGKVSAADAGRIKALTKENERLRRDLKAAQQPSQLGPSPGWYTSLSRFAGPEVLLVALLLVLAAVFGSGVYYMDYLNRKRHGGFRL